MKVAPIALLAALATTTSAVTQDTMTCLRNHPNIYNAINAFCKGDIVVPSTYANAGTRSGGKWVGIRGNCNPPQWVPYKYCISQLQTVCARAPASGNHEMKWGRNQCQTFVTWTM